MNLYFRLFWAFFKIGAFTFGGGYAMIPLIQREVVDRKKWLEEDEFIDMLAIAQSVPGPISLNTAVFVGNKGKSDFRLGDYSPFFYCYFAHRSGIYRIQGQPRSGAGIQGNPPGCCGIDCCPVVEYG
jgi:hypothetical protein